MASSRYIETCPVGCQGVIQNGTNLPAGGASTHLLDVGYSNEIAQNLAEVLAQSARWQGRMYGVLLRRLVEA